MSEKRNFGLETTENSAVSGLHHRNSPAFVNKKEREIFLAELQNETYGQLMSTVISEIYLGEQSQNVDKEMLRQDHRTLMDFVSGVVKVLNANVSDEVKVVKEFMAELPEITFKRMLWILEIKHNSDLVLGKSAAEKLRELV